MSQQQNSTNNSREVKNDPNASLARPNDTPEQRALGYLLLFGVSCVLALAVAVVFNPRVVIVGVPVGLGALITAVVIRRLGLLERGIFGRARIFGDPRRSYLPWEKNEVRQEEERRRLFGG